MDPTNPTRRLRRLDPQLLSDLYILQQVVRAGGAGAAARQIGVSQSAISQRLTRLEARLGVTLFRRERDGLRLTAKGGPLAQAVEEALERIVHALSDLHPESTQTVRVNCTPSLAREWLVPSMTDFYDRHPELTLEIYADQEAMTPARMAAEGIDITIRYAPEAPTGFVELACIPEYIAPVRAPGARTGPTTRLHDETPWIGADRDAEWRGWTAAAQRNWRDERDQRFNLASLAYDAAAAGHGVAIGRLALVAMRLTDGRLVAADPQIAAGASYRVLVLRTPDRQSAAMAFMRWLADRLARTQEAARKIIEGHRFA